MAKYLITYDLKSGSPDEHKIFLAEAEKEGLLYVWTGDTNVLRLPETTIWGVFASVDDALAAFDLALEETSRRVGYSIELERRFVAGMDGVMARSNVRKKPVPKWTGSTTFETSRLHQLNDPDFR
jgi:hypothetical protein